MTSSLQSLVQQKQQLENLLKRRFFVAPSFEIYGAASGLFDFGPAGCAVKNELEAHWRRHFVLEEDLMEICGPNLTPHNVLKASGHVDRFLDFMVEDLVTKECYRADKLIEEFLEDPKNRKTGDEAEIQRVLIDLEGMSADDMFNVIQKYKIVSPLKNPLSKPYPFNLMFSTQIGPKAGALAYLRPETAQGIFVNFRRLLEQNQGRMPFGAACVGTSFRNEIAPRNGLLRVREFPMCEIEYFCDPACKSPFSKFAAVQDLVLPLYSKRCQEENSPLVEISLKDAVATGIIGNETLAYFIGRTYLFLMDIGISRAGLRFRQHLATEMAHYASDCWDAEILSSSKWIECVGIADRSAFDLTQHTVATGVDLKASRVLPEPRIDTVMIARPNRKLMGPHFKQQLQAVLAAIDNMDSDAKVKAHMALAGGADSIEVEGFVIPSKLIAFEQTTVKVSEETYVPNVIEPSFGIGRLFHCMMEHAFRSRGIEGQEDRNFLALSPIVAPIKCSILPLSTKPELKPFVDLIRSDLLSVGCSSKIDASGATIGKRYARTDELGIPFGVTVDYQTVKDSTVTLRELITMEQVRLPIKEVAPTVAELCKLRKKWSDVLTIYPKFEGQELE